MSYNFVEVSFYLTDSGSQHVSLNLSLLSPISDFLPKHAFPHDFRSGPSSSDWDPSKWIILALHKLGLVTSLRRARSGDLKEAIEYMRQKETLGIVELEADTWNGGIWDKGQVQEYAKKVGKCVVMIDDFVVDVTSYLGDHVSRLLRLKLVRTNFPLCSREEPAYCKNTLSNWQRT